MEGWEIIKTDQGNAKVLNNIFSRFIKYLGIPQYNQAVSISQSAKSPLIAKIPLILWVQRILLLTKEIILVLLKSKKGVLLNFGNWKSSFMMRQDSEKWTNKLRKSVIRCQCGYGNHFLREKPKISSEFSEFPKQKLTLQKFI